MKYKKISALLLCLCASVSSAQAGVDAKLTPTLDGKVIQFHVADNIQTSNPNHGMEYELHFGKHDYYYEDTVSKSKVTGTYQYQILDLEKGVAIINFHEQYQQKKSDYSVLVYAENAESGLYIYKQTTGPVKPDARMNFGSYKIHS